MVSRKIYLLFYMLLMAAGYVAVYIFLTPLDLFQFISLLFLSLAFTFFYFFPVLLPKKGKAYFAMRFKLYFAATFYLIATAAVGYMFSFIYKLDGVSTFLGLVMDESFYFLGETALMVFFLIIIMICLKTPKSEKVEADSGYEYPDVPATTSKPEVINKEEQDTDEGVYDDDQDQENKS